MSKISDTWCKKRKKKVCELVLMQRELKRAAGFQPSSAVIGDEEEAGHHCGEGLKHPWGLLHPADPALAGHVCLNNPPQELPWQQSLWMAKTFSIKS